MDHDSATSLPPGVRFQPNEDELFYYLKHKVSGKPLDCDPIAVVDVYKSEPWDLRSKSRLKTRDREWYFFSALGRKFGNGSRIKRTTEKGYWKTTGKDRVVRRNSRTVGMMKKILVFHTGRAPHGVRTNWVMHEYRLDDKELDKAGIAKGALVLCKIILNGKASFSEEGGEHDDMGVVGPGEEAATEDVVVHDCEYVKAKDEDKSKYMEYSGELIGYDQQTIIGTGETSELHHDQKFVDIPEQYGMDASPFSLNLDIDLPDMDFNSFEGFYPSEFLGTENTSSCQTPATHKNEIGEADQVSKESLRLSKLQGSNDACSSKHNPKALMDESGSLCSLLFPQIDHFYSNRNPDHNSDIDQCNSNAMDHDLATLLPPGYRFQPNEDELFYYLKHKVSGKPLDCEPIAVVEVYKSEPWDLRSKSRLKTSDREWYFFSALGRKYGNGLRISRTTEKGYWKTTGKDRVVRRNSRTVGMMKKILVFHTGRAPHGVRTNWVMHEYRLDDKELEKAGIAKGALVLCKIILNGKASFSEEGGEHDDMGVVGPGEEAATEDVVVHDCEYVKAKDEDKSNYIEYSGDFIGDFQQPIIGTGETSELHHDQKFVDIPEQYGMDANPYRDELFIEANDFSNPTDVDPEDFGMADGSLNLDNDLSDMDFDSFKDFYPSEFFGTESTSFQQPIIGTGETSELHHDQKFVDIPEQYGMDANPYRDELFIEANDFSNPTDVDPEDFAMADGFLNLDNDLPDMDFDSLKDFYPSEFFGTSSHQTPTTHKNEIGEADQVSKESLRLSKLQGSNDACSSKHNSKALMDESDVTWSGNFSELENACSNT